MPDGNQECRYREKTNCLLNIYLRARGFCCDQLSLALSARTVRIVRCPGAAGGRAFMLVTRRCFGCRPSKSRRAERFEQTRSRTLQMQDQNADKDYNQAFRHMPAMRQDSIALRTMLRLLSIEVELNAPIRIKGYEKVPLPRHREIRIKFINARRHLADRR